ncbi:MAG: GGDEF and EAL domain-containing protein [Acidimicrobiales bacterium]|nr:GGDEF and EAL domain-containing protein [Acidimicrobiales bacterium]
MKGAVQKGAPTEVVVPRTLGAPAAEVDEIVSEGPRLAIAAADLSVAVAERTTGRVQWRSEAWIDRFGLIEILSRHLPESHEFSEWPLPPAGETWRRSRTLHNQSGDEVLYDLVLIGAATERGTHYVTILATERIGAGGVVTDRPEVLEIISESLEEAAESSVAAVYIDLDRFERLAAAIGNVSAVRVVEQVSRKISSTMRATDMLFRLQGDEFMILAVGLAGHESAEDLGERVRSAIATLPEPSEGLPLTASVGVAVNEAGQSAQNLFAAAETAVQLAKGRGRNRVVLSDEALPSRNERLITVERQLRRAIEHRNVSFAYQPLVRISNRQVEGAEALLRIGGDVGLSATEVVATAERAGLMGALGILVVDGVEEQLGDWLVKPDTVRRLMINVARSQLLDAEFVTLLSMISGHPELAGRFGIELSATSFGENADTLRELVTRMGAGMPFGVDGFSDLAQPLAPLAEAGVSYIKLHRNVVSRLPIDEMSREMAERLVSEAQSLGLEVIGIGVEKETECEALSQIGCDLAQGFLFSKAVSAEEFLRSCGEPDKPALV